MNPNWLDMLVYRLYVWRWQKILQTNPILREMLISWLKAFDVLDEGDKVKIIVSIKKVNDE